MSGDFNQAIIMGNLTRDPEMRYTPNGQPVTTFSIATNRRWKNNEGQLQEETEFHNVVAWGKLAEICGQILYKGRKALVSGRIKTRHWEGQDGSKRTVTEIIADTISATGSPKTSGESSLVAATEETSTQTSQKSADNAKPAKDNADDEINLDEIPF